MCIHPLFCLGCFWINKSHGRLFLKGGDETVPRTSTLIDSSKHRCKVKAILNFRSFRFLPTRLLLGLYDYRFKHLAVMEEEDRDIITTIQVNGLAQFFGLEELESRTTPFQEGEDDEDIPTVHASSSPKDTNLAPLTRSLVKKLQEQVNSFLTDCNF